MFHVVDSPAGFGQVTVRSTVLDAIVRGPYWAQWPSTWRRGLAAGIRPPAPGAWTGPEGVGPARNNLASMVKWIDEMRRADLAQPAGYFTPPCGEVG